MENRQFQQKVWHDKTAKARVFEIGELVFVKSPNRDCNWLPGKITKVTGPLSYHVSLSDGRERRCHVDQLRARLSDSVAGGGQGGHGPPIASAIFVCTELYCFKMYNNTIIYLIYTYTNI